MGSPAIPFHLTRWSDGRLTIDDTATGQLIELEAFGHTNEDAFARLLDLSPPLGGKLIAATSAACGPAAGGARHAARPATPSPHA